MHVCLHGCTGHMPRRTIWIRVCMDRGYWVGVRMGYWVDCVGQCACGALGVFVCTCGVLDGCM